jgi:precorrin-6A synthase
VWGDPAIYDSTLAVLDDVLAREERRVRSRGHPRHQQPAGAGGAPSRAVQRVGGAVQITTGAPARSGLPADADDVLVMLDSDCTFARLDDDLDIYWGAYVGTPDEILIAGRTADVAGEIQRARREARQRKGWVMDSYLLRRPLPPR